jgi:BlaI family penicillinase repressor
MIGSMKIPNISEAEWTVMEVLWERAPQTASEVAKSLSSSAGWAVNTVRTLLARLVDKGALHSADNRAGVREFTPAIERETMVDAAGRSFLDRIFKGAAQPLLVHFASQSQLSAEEVEQLKRLLDDSVNKSA